MFVKKVLMIVLVSVIYLINLNIPVAAEENEQDIIFSPNWMLENGYKEEVEENQEILPFATRVNVNWKVGLKTEKKTKTFHKNAGSKITVEASVFPTKKIRIGKMCIRDRYGRACDDNFGTPQIYAEKLQKRRFLFWNKQREI